MWLFVGITVLPNVKRDGPLLGTGSLASLLPVVAHVGSGKEARGRLALVKQRRPLTDPKQLFRAVRRVRPLASRRPSDEVEVTLTMPREVWEVLEAQGPGAVEGLAKAVINAAKLPRRR